MIVLVGGGSRSGKSRFALDRARLSPAPRAFIATAEALDDEMRARARAHRAERAGEFDTFEEPLDIAARIRDSAGYTAIVVDCLTLWLSNLMFASRDIAAETSTLLSVAADSPATVFLVTNEVGSGIVPDNELSRRFRDEAGRLNQRAAAAAQEAWLMAFGLPLRLK